MKKTLKITVLLIIAFAVIMCNKDLDDIFIKLHEDYETIAQQGDTVKIAYSCSSSSIDSIAIMVNDIQHARQTEIHDYIPIFAAEKGNYQFQLIAYFKTKQIAWSETGSFYVNPLESPTLSYQVTTLDGSFHYFVGDELLVTVLPKYDPWDLSLFKEVSFSFYGELIGTKTSAPFQFKTPPVLYNQNRIDIGLLDSAHRFHEISHMLEVPDNPPAQITFTTWGNQNGNSMCYYSTDSIGFWYNVRDLADMARVDIYIGDMLVISDTGGVDVSATISNTQYVHSVPPGDYQAYLVGIDTRGDSTISDPIDIRVVKTVDIADKIIDTEPTQNPSIAYAITKSQLLVLNAENESIDQLLDLPFANATAIDYVPTEGRLYICFQQGEIVFWDQSSNSFNTVATGLFSNLRDIEIDYIQQTAILLNNGDLYTFNLSSSDTINANLNLREECVLGYSKISNTVVVGGQKQSSYNTYHKLKLENSQLTHLTYNNLSGYVQHICINPTKDELLIDMSLTTHQYYLYDIDNFGSISGVFYTNNNQSLCFSSTGEYVYTAEDSHDQIVCFNSETSEVLHAHFIPISTYRHVEHLIPVPGDEKIILIEYESSPNETKILFSSLIN